MRHAAAAMVALAVAIAGCAPTAPIPAAADREVQAWLATDQKPLSVTPIASWYANGTPGDIVCGEIEAPAALRDQQAALRYTYDLHGHHGQVEMHRLWIAGDALGQGLIEANRSIFNDTWKNYCAPNAPLSRRLAHTFL